LASFIRFRNFAQFVTSLVASKHHVHGYFDNYAFVRSFCR